ncbi:DUF3325 domain-containing protein [Zestomonas carbonaria]|uniref:DUF3325 domain-containing protein n=1 Tax=Zestomonas carbonaria TaxID=2762745 RepID=A0A7U7ENG1_9GAMM|nr:DUF3325 domain-containing protein [Pseudomonas carbonaria]CAD5108121.1 hypothetical protein PSEWESI4_02405 [Pseudomonas carbonaria]
MLWLSFAFTYLAMLTLSLAMSRHHKTLFGAAPSAGRSLLLRSGAIAALVVGLVLSIAELGGEIGSVTWLCQLMLAGLLLVALMAWRQRWVLPLAALLPAGALLQLLF